MELETDDSEKEPITNGLVEDCCEMKSVEKQSLLETDDSEKQPISNGLVENCCEMKSGDQQSLRNDLLDYLCKSKIAHFKSQQISDPELEDAEKRVIAEGVLDRSSGIFLARFGEHILQEHLVYFEGCSEEERYEVDFYLNKLRGSLKTKKVKVKNRRFEALKQMVNEGSYFSEYEMKKRNPLLYDHLVGQFLTEEEERERTGIDTSNITFVNLLLEQYDRAEMNKLKKQQKDDEDNQKEESDDDSDEDDNLSNSNNDYDMSEESMDDDDDTVDKTTLWGEAPAKTRNTNTKSSIAVPPGDPSELPGKTRSSNLETDGSSNFIKSPKTTPEDRKSRSNNLPTDGTSNFIKPPKTMPDDMLTEDERELLMEEFRSSMFNSFLQGKDADFNYKDVDENSEYDDLEARTHDEEEKYFDSEIPEDALNSEPMEADDGSNGGDDEIDRYVAGLSHEANDTQLADKMKMLQHD